MTSGTSCFRFSCTSCGNCCREYRVPLTTADLRRLAPLQPDALEWLAPEQVNMVGEPETFVQLPVGRRLLVLRHVAGGCIFLRDNRCGVYERRPRSCRIYPFDVQLGRRHLGVRRLRLLGQESCVASHGRAIRPERLAAEKRAEQSELVEYVRHVARFNRLQRQRMRLGKRQLDETQFFRALKLT